VVLKVWSKRHRDLARLRNQVACRLHAVLCDVGHSGTPNLPTRTREPPIWSVPGSQESADSSIRNKSIWRATIAVGQGDLSC
jgi:hypothetical protein